MRDAALKELITAAYEANYRVYGARKIWRELHRQGHPVARCTVERLMRELGLTGAVRGKRGAATMPDPPTSAPRPSQARVRREGAEPGMGSPTSPTCRPGAARVRLLRRGHLSRIVG